MESTLKWASHLNFTLHLSQHLGNWRIVQILVRLPSEIFIYCRTMTSTLTVVHFLKCRFEDFPNRSSAVIACSWWRWHTQQRNFWRPDLVTNCLSLVFRMHFAGHCLQRLMQQIPTEERISCPLTRISEWSFRLFCNTSPQRSLHVSPCLLLHLIPTKVEHILWSQFLHGLTENCIFFEWHPTKPQSSSNCFASVVRLSASAVIVTCA